MSYFDMKRFSESKMYHTNLYIQTIRKMCVRKVRFVGHSMRCHA